MENNEFSIISQNVDKIAAENKKKEWTCPTGYVCPIPDKTLGEKTLLVINDLTIKQLAAVMGAEYDPITKEYITAKERQDAKVAMLALGFSKTLSGPVKLTDEAIIAIGKKYGKDIATEIKNNSYKDGDAQKVNKAVNEALRDVYTTPKAREELLDKLSAKMQKPLVSDLKLQRITDDLYPDNAKIGSGSTADAVRYEMSTGNKVGGKTHTEKAMGYSDALSKWIKSNPNASSNDKMAAELMLRDLQNALKGK
ncbi:MULTISPECIES: hypothetical protein [unclassified Acinetobacter]|uniref:hypothetical protein n=1 Tax=unclassified Acinetobacter TaxID=196816 RepID=UPI002934716D|nr:MULTISPECIES: hypothetical protein [unclassified Acinetobacter]WOE32004.1 hypothetical protein QSG84_01900 [Acinetobacter sp. SAAs470]WOE37472.1 hypothetical protein QSG86_10945 [Acinetobacter sp. SAAs474]